MGPIPHLVRLLLETTSPPRLDSPARRGPPYKHKRASIVPWDVLARRHGYTTLRPRLNFSARHDPVRSARRGCIGLFCPPVPPLFRTILPLSHNPGKHRHPERRGHPVSVALPECPAQRLWRTTQPLR